MIIPLPSELVMPFAGFLAVQGSMNFWLVILFSVAGSLAGSTISYYMGLWGGNRLVLKFGKYLFLDETDLKKTEAWFAKSGEKTIFIGRFVPVVRHLISIPAGIGKMNLKKFYLFTFLGAGIWNAFLAATGYVLGKKWNMVRHYSEPFSLTIVALLLIAGGILIYHHIKNKRRQNI
jgi:membrane protein DedA with SNARE-associated domain